MRSWLGVAVVVGSVGLVGCTGAAGGGAEEGGGPGLVMLDGEAREAGFSLVTPEGRVTPVAPIELEEGTTLVGPGQRIPLAGAPGEVLVVTGKRGALVPRTLSTEIDGDAVRVSGSEQGVRTLASALDAKVSGEGPWEVRAPGLFKSLSHLGDLEGVTAIDAIDVNASDVAAAAAAAGAPKPFSAHDPRYASFSSLGARAPACSDPAVGTWVSTPQNSSAWHIFTLHVQPGAQPGDLAGTVRAHVWSGDETEEAPDACGEAEMDYRVVMQATGRRTEDGGFRFDAGPWRDRPGLLREPPVGLQPRPLHRPLRGWRLPVGEQRRRKLRQHARGVRARLLRVSRRRGPARPLRATPFPPRARDVTRPGAHDRARHRHRLRRPRPRLRRLPRELGPRVPAGRRRRAARPHAPRPPPRHPAARGARRSRDGARGRAGAGGRRGVLPQAEQHHRGGLGRARRRHLPRVRPPPGERGGPGARARARGVAHGLVRARRRGLRRRGARRRLDRGAHGHPRGGGGAAIDRSRGADRAARRRGVGALRRRPPGCSGWRPWRRVHPQGRARRDPSAALRLAPDPVPDRRLRAGRFVAALLAQLGGGTFAKAADLRADLGADRKGVGSTRTTRRTPPPSPTSPATWSAAAPGAPRQSSSRASPRTWRHGRPGARVLPGQPEDRERPLRHALPARHARLRRPIKANFRRHGRAHRRPEDPRSALGRGSTSRPCSTPSPSPARPSGARPAVAQALHVRHRRRARGRGLPPRGAVLYGAPLPPGARGGRGRPLGGQRSRCSSACRPGSRGPWCRWASSSRRSSRRSDRRSHRARPRGALRVGNRDHGHARPGRLLHGDGCLGPIADNAAGIVEMTVARERPDVRGRTVVLDAVGNTVKALTNAWAAGAAALSSVLLVAAYLNEVQRRLGAPAHPLPSPAGAVAAVPPSAAEGFVLHLDRPEVAIAAVLGVLLVVWLASRCIVGVARPARRVVEEVRRQLLDRPSVARPTTRRASRWRPARPSATCSPRPSWRRGPRSPSVWPCASPGPGMTLLSRTGSRPSSWPGQSPASWAPSSSATQGAPGTTRRSTSRPARTVVATSWTSPARAWTTRRTSPRWWATRSAIRSRIS